MKLSQSTTYGVQAVLRLAAGPQLRPISCGQLASEGNMPERFLLQILRDLTKRDILRSTRGGGGGFTLQRPLEEVSLLDVIEAVDGPLPAGLPAKVSFPVDVGRRLGQSLERITEQTRHELAAVKLSQFLPSPESDNGRAAGEHGPKVTSGA